MYPETAPTTVPEILYNYNQVHAFDSSVPISVVWPQHDQTHGPPNSSVPMIVLTVSTLIALLLVVRVWKSHGRLFEKLFWSAFLFVPFFGPLFFLVFYPGRSELEARRWAAMSSVYRLGGGGGMGL